MKTQAIDYDLLYNEARKLFHDNHASYNLDRKAENLAYLIALETGLRVSDLLSLEYSFITYDKRLKKNIFTTYIKKTKGTHVGVISDEVSNYIEMYKESVKSCYNALNGSIFFNYKSNKLYSRQWLYKRMKLISDRLGFKDAGVHSIRKASAIKVLDSTGSLSMAQYHLTHKRATTTDNYLGISQASALDRLSKVF